jgi:hypothetical protein
MQLTDLRLDAMSELATIGSGNAATAFCSLLVPSRPRRDRCEGAAGSAGSPMPGEIMVRMGEMAVVKGLAVAA